jgi:porphobilinogen deaminase
MSFEKTIWRFGTRGSELALWQTQHVMNALQLAQPEFQFEQVLMKHEATKLLIRHCLKLKAREFLQLS